MSWAEVKKINSNLDVPLNELMYGSYYQATSVHGNSSTFEITGKGIVHGLTVGNNKRSSANEIFDVHFGVKIELDGEVIDNCYLRVYGTVPAQYYNFHSCCYAIYPKNLEQIYATSNVQSDHFMGLAHTYASIYNSISEASYDEPHNWNPSSELRRIEINSNSQYPYVIGLIKEGLFFKESVKVTVFEGTDSPQMRIAYTLVD